MQACDKDGSGHVDYNEFMAAFVSQAEDIGVPVPRTNSQLRRLATEHSIGRPRVGRRRVFADVAQAKQAEAQDAHIKPIGAKARLMTEELEPPADAAKEMQAFPRYHQTHSNG